MANLSGPIDDVGLGERVGDDNRKVATSSLGAPTNHRPDGADRDRRLCTDRSSSSASAIVARPVTEGGI